MNYDHFMWVFILALMGAATGSFANVVIYRVPKMLFYPDVYFNLFLPRSRCPSCETTLSWRNNIPLLSWYLLRGKCAHCHTSINYRYPMTEALFTVMAALSAYLFPFSSTAIIFIFLFLIFWCLAVIDLQHGLLPDILTQPLIWSGFLYCQFFNSHIYLETAVTGAIAAWLSLWLIYWLVFFLIGREGLGYGDMKLFAGIGAWNGWEPLPIIMLCATSLTLIFPFLKLLRKKDNWYGSSPFGPGLAASGGIYWIFKELSMNI
jgi:leader peptidase (prepilin peptidase)/N-methyltransferase